MPDPSSEIGQDPHLLVACQSNFDVMWQQNHCGIFRTEDGGNNWLDISDPSGEANFGFAIAADPKDDKTAWVVPALSDGIRVALNNSLWRVQNGKWWKILGDLSERASAGWLI